MTSSRPATRPPLRAARTRGFGPSALLAVGLVALLFVSNAVAHTVAVTAIHHTSGDNPCRMKGQTGAGFVTTGGGSVEEPVIANGGIFLSCTISTVSSTTAGFSISGANTPLNGPARGSRTLSFKITAPHSEYTGVLTIDTESGVRLRCGPRAASLASE
ncbi:MAG TPA: hypothetical protein VFF67_00425 [Thermoplasmata archaeon]|nr:hypothetical protein [Thermoplasmata archaeon]